MPILYAETEISAPQAAVWDALLRKDQWRFWNTFLYDCDPGLPLKQGGEIFLAMQRLEGDEETEFQPVITMMRPPYMMRWVSSIPGLRTEHIFELRESVPGRTRYIHKENFSGVLSKVFLPFIRQDERQGLRRMAQQLKMYVEGGSRAVPRDRYGSYNRYDPGYGDPRYEQQPYGAGNSGRYGDYRQQPNGGDRQYRDPYNSAAYGPPSYDPSYDQSYGAGNSGAYSDRRYNASEPGYQGDRYSESGYSDQGYGRPDEASRHNEASYRDPRYAPPGAEQRPYDQTSYDQDSYNQGSYAQRGDPRYDAQPRYDEPPYRDPSYDAPSYDDRRRDQRPDDQRSYDERYQSGRDRRYDPRDRRDNW